jgi:hypothetical protein
MLIIEAYCMLHDEFTLIDKTRLIDSDIVRTLDGREGEVENVHRAYITF